jgi:uncharacterized protein YfaS (alpha-2-macroglobulin family)
MDLSGTGEMDIPDVDKGGKVRARAVAWSAGEDGDATTWGRQREGLGMTASGPQTARGAGGGAT